MIYTEQLHYYFIYITKFHSLTSTGCKRTWKQETNNIYKSNRHCKEQTKKVDIYLQWFIKQSLETLYVKRRERLVT